jgi:hypothetical protein
MERFELWDLLAALWRSAFPFFVSCWAFRVDLRLELEGSAQTFGCLVEKFRWLLGDEAVWSAVVEIEKSEEDRDDQEDQRKSETCFGV